MMLKVSLIDRTAWSTRLAQNRRCLRNDERTVLLSVLEVELRDSGSISIDQ